MPKEPKKPKEPIFGPTIRPGPCNNPSPSPSSLPLCPFPSRSPVSQATAATHPPSRLPLIPRSPPPLPAPARPRRGTAAVTLPHGVAASSPTARWPPLPPPRHDDLLPHSAATSFPSPTGHGAVTFSSTLMRGGEPATLTTARRRRSKSRALSGAPSTAKAPALGASPRG